MTMEIWICPECGYAPPPREAGYDLGEVHRRCARYVIQEDVEHVKRPHCPHLEAVADQGPQHI